MKRGWQSYLLYTSAVLVFGSLALFFIKLGYSYSATGFGDFTTPDGVFERGKTLWDWMELLIIPAVLAGGAILLNRSERRTEREIAKDRQQEDALQAYIKSMSELLLDKKLRTTDEEEVRDIARTMTISVLRVLNRDRNNIVLRFLFETKLVINKTSILNNANLRGVNLRELDLSLLFMQHADLQKGNLYGAKLNYSNLEGAFMTAANLELADLQQANMKNAWLKGANFKGANLEGAKLDGAVLERAEISDEQLSEVKSLKGATMPDGTIHE